MNYKEFKRANILLDTVENINRMLEDIKEYNFVSIHSKHFVEYFVEDENKKELVEFLECLRDKRVKKLNELGLTED